MKKQITILFSLAFLYSISAFSQPGTLDRDFSADGIIVNDIAGFDYCYSVAVQQDGKIIAFGTSDWELATLRYNVDGTLDNTFGEDGALIEGFSWEDFGNTVVIQPDGKICLCT